MHTIVSLAPFEIKERKANQIPPDYYIPASVNGQPELLHVGTARYGIFLDSDRGSVEQIIPSSEVARGLIDDFCTSLLAFSHDAKPALFAVEGKHSVDEVKTKFPKEIGVAKALQANWFVRLVKMADDSWQKYRRHSAISDYQIYAGRALGLDKEWLLTPEEMQDCPACAARVRPNIAICPVCRCILDEAKASKLKFATKVG